MSPEAQRLAPAFPYRVMFVDPVELARHFTYDLTSGEIWRGSARADKLRRDGYMQIAYKGRHLRASSVAWALHYGVWPRLVIDHINGHPADNRISNLREVDSFQNQHNACIRKDNTSGFKGVSKHTDLNKWVARIRAFGVQHYLGLFPTPEDAAKAYQAAQEKYHGDFRRKT